jgi:hypothetical protein
MTVIELSDEQAAALKAKAAAQGLTLEAWLQDLATVEAPARPRQGPLQPVRTDGSVRSKRPVIGERSRFARQPRRWPRGLVGGARRCLSRRPTDTRLIQ